VQLAARAVTHDPPEHARAGETALVGPVDDGLVQDVALGVPVALAEVDAQASGIHAGLLDLLAQGQTDHHQDDAGHGLHGDVEPGGEQLGPPCSRLAVSKAKVENVVNAPMKPVRTITRVCGEKPARPAASPPTRGEVDIAAR